MPLFLYDLPNWLLGITVVGATTAAAFPLYFLARRIIGFEFSEAQKGLAMAILAVVATVNSLLLAFSAVSVWDSFHSADEAVADEANTVGALARDLAVFNTPKSDHARALLRDYTKMFITDEWPQMQRGQASLDTWNAFDDTFVAASALDVTTIKEETMMGEIFQRTNELLKQRRTRLYTAESEVPSTLWAVVFMGTMDRPFAGTESISPAPFQSALDNMERWDRRSTQVRTSHGTN